MWYEFEINNMHDQNTKSDNMQIVWLSTTLINEMSVQNDWLWLNQMQTDSLSG